MIDIDNPQSDERDFVLNSTRPRALRIALYSVAISFIALIVIGFVLKVPRQVEVSCHIKGSTPERIYRFAEDVFVEEYYIRTGQNVQKGERLMRISSPHIASLVMEYTLACLQEELFERMELPVHAKTQAELRLQQQKVLRQLERTQQEQRFILATQQVEIQKLELAARAAREQLEQLRKLHAKGYIAETEHQQAELQKATAEEELERAREQYRRDIASIQSKARELALDRSIVGRSQEKLTLEMRNRRAQLQTARETAYHRLRSLYGEFDLDSGAIIIKAPSDGLIVSYISDAERQVPAGAIVLRLAESPRHFFAVASVESKDVASLHKGQKAIIKLAAFPPLRWGALEGLVRSVSLSPSERNTYVLEVSIEYSGGFTGILQEGLEGTMTVMVEERPIIAYVFERFMRLLE